MKKNAFYLFTYCSLLISCSTSDVNNDKPSDGSNENSNNSSQWLIPISDVKDGGPGKDGIPSIDNPFFTTANNANFLNDNDLVVGIIEGDQAKAYPHFILDWHEVVNDEISNTFFTLNYCPLTGTAFAWESISNGTRTTFGVSGLLYNANLILYDRNTDSNWSQLRLECVNGQLINNTPKLIDVVETNWKTWKTLYPNTEVLTTQTGFSRTYGTSPYGDYATNNNRFIFTPEIINTSLPNKKRIYAIIDGDKSKVYQFSDFNNGNVIRDTFKATDYLIVGNNNLIYGYELSGDQKDLTFDYGFSNSEAFFKDNEGNKWSIFGKAIEGPRQGETLLGAKSVISYWFAIAAFYPDPEIYTP
ncbi:DUF3179 domain-containing protein [Flavivirga amylovorans]|uniref:DUF3179 domain-containing protein n=1 Tax=Flavivirga amylovorans TaxID=870486 RepID=A0ABT8X2W5_9FLAO|nr:DUF3179 domain-containing protein [Flavivirga amylovorans]MDO5988301.1 DUF3179 domain-containing protein [Flavivirga amylovorans]